MQSAVGENEVPCFGYRETTQFWKGLRETGGRCAGVLHARAPDAVRTERQSRWGRERAA